MTKISRKQFVSWSLFLFVLFIALFCREINENQNLFVSTMLGIIQTVIYTGLVAFWGMSVCYRIVPLQIRRLLEAISILLFIWFLHRGIKYYALRFFTNTEHIKRYLWYSYYIPMLVLPVVLLMVACLLRKPENYRLLKKTVMLLFSISAILFTMVITNDVHQLVFRFPADAVVFTDDDYSYGILYYPCFVWMTGCVITSLVIMIKKCRIPNSKKILWLPLLPLVACIGYCIAYMTGNVSFFNDIIVVDGFLLIALLEMAITVGLIPSNTHYVELFRASNLSAVITDQNFSPVFLSETAVIPNHHILQQAAETGSVAEKGVRLLAYPIHGGYAFWQEDMTELMGLIAELEELKKELEGKREILQEVVYTEHKRQSLAEKNRLYNIMQNQTQDKVERLYALAEELKEQNSEKEIIRLIDEIAVISAYLKRRNNLIFIAEEDDKLSASELSYCLKESLSNLKMCGVLSNLHFQLEGLISFENATTLYDIFQIVVETVLPDLTALFVIVTENDRDIFLTLNVQSSVDLFSLKNHNLVVEQDDENEWTLQYLIQKEGENL